MQFGLLRLIDQILGRILLLILAPICHTIGALLKPKQPLGQKTFSFLKLHGGGSLLIALPSLLGIRKKYPDAEFALVCTAETQKYAELTGLFDRYVLIEPQNFLLLIVTGFRALACSMRHDVCVDLEPHSYLAGVFTVLTLGARRLGFVKPNEIYRARAYTDALYFNPHAPIYDFYDQLAGLLDAGVASIDECRKYLASHTGRAAATTLPATTKRPVIYLSPFCSDFAPERMMPNELWPRLLKQKYGDAAATILIGGGKADMELGNALRKILGRELPLTDVIYLCGERTLPQTVEDIRAADVFWGIDSGPLHIARMLGKACHSFWGPTRPHYLLRPMPGLEETVTYLGFACSPCIHMIRPSPCRGDNQCMKSLLDPPAATPPIRIKL